MNVSIIMPVKDDLEGLRVTLQSLAGIERGGHDVEVIVCNDGGPAAVSALARGMGCQVVVLPENRGSYAARNQGLQMASGDVLAFVDADERVDPLWLIDGLRALADADYVGGAVEIELSAVPSAWEIYDRIAAFPVRYYLERRHFAPTANLFVRRVVFERVGGFEEALKSGGDREFGVRVHRAGFRMAYCASAVTYHPARDFREQKRKVARVARGATELEYLAWNRPARRVLREALVALLKTPLRALARIPGLARPPVSGGDAWQARHHLMWGLVVVLYQWARVRHLLQLVREHRKDSWVSRISALPPRRED